MRVEQNVSFNGRIKKPVNSKNEFVRYSINYLKHNVGGRNVEHNIIPNEAENSLMVFTKLFAIDNKYSYNTFKRLDLTSKEKITQQANEITSWLKRMKNAN